MDFSVFIGILGTIIGIGGAIIGFTRNTRNDGKDSGKEIGQILADVGYIKSTITEIKEKVDRQDKRHIDIVTKLTVLDTFRSMAEETFRSTDQHLREIDDAIDILRAELNELLKHNGQ